MLTAPTEFSRRTFLAGVGGFAAFREIPARRPRRITTYLLDETGAYLTDEAGNRLTG